MRRSDDRPQTAAGAMNATLAAAGCLALGASLMYLLDPAIGRRRRSIIRGKMTRALNRSGTAMRKTAEYTSGQARGMVAETRARFRNEEVTDEQLCARVRSAMGRVVSHPSAIEVTASNGLVILSGPILADEVDDLVGTVESVRGVQDVEDRLDVHEEADISALQGPGRRPGWRIGAMQENWPPTTRLGAMLLGGTLGFWGAARRDPIGLVLGGMGVGLLLRGATNLPARRIVGIGAGRRAVDVQKTININAPKDMVFSFFADWANFPYFMSNVVEVRDHGSGRSHWVVKGPAGISVQWDADLTRYVPNELITWKSVEGAAVENAGIIRFDLNDDGTTRVDIKLSYNPPGGAIGHALAKMFGADPKSEMDQDLMRVKTVLETGQPAHDAARK